MRVSTVTSLALMALAGCYRTHTRVTDAGSTPDAAVDAPMVRERCLVLANASFDEPAFDFDVSGATELEGWSVEVGDVDILVSGGEFGVGTDGRNYLDLNGLAPGTLSQRVSGLVIGARYRVAFSLSGNSGAHPLELSFADASGVVTSQPYTGSGPVLPTPASAWRTETFSFIATAGEGVLRIRWRESDPTHGALLDFFRCPDGVAP